MSHGIYKVGDTVTVISLDEVRRGTPSGGGYLINGITFDRMMNKYCGGNFKIIKVSGPSRRLAYNLDLPSPNPSWYFSEGMIRPTTDPSSMRLFSEDLKFNKELL